MPVAASDIPVHREIGGDCCHYFPAGDAEAAAVAVTAALAAGGPVGVRLPTWEDCAAGYLRVYRDVVASA